MTSHDLVFIPRYWLRVHLNRQTCSLALICWLPACTSLKGPDDTFGGMGGTTQTGGTTFFDTASAVNHTGGGVAMGGAPTTQSSASGGSDAGAGSAATCTVPNGLGNLPCYSCAPYDIATLESACSSAACSPFNNRLRLTQLGSNGQLPVLPLAAGSGGSTSASSGATAMGGSSLPPSSSSAMGGGSAPASSSGATAGSSNGGGSSGTSTSSANPCDALSTKGTLIYVTGSSAAKPFLQQIAQQLAAPGLGSSPVFIVYTSTGSCVGVDAILNNTPMTTGPAPAPASSATYWSSSSDPGTACTLPVGGVNADLGISDVFAQTCPGFELSSLEAIQVRDSHGPIQTMGFAVPANASQSSISAQAAYFVYGFGSSGGVLDATGTAPVWNDEAYILQRSPASGTQAMIAASIGVPTSAWKGKPSKSSDDVAAALQAATSSQAAADKTIGILAADYIDSKNLRAQIRMLAFQDTSQPCAMYPDSTTSARDKRNVRDGHYPIWGPLHILYKVNASGEPLNPANRQPILDIVGYMSGTKPLPNGIKLIDLYAQSGLIPECAMHVSRQHDGGSIVPYSPTNPCSCLFEFKATGSTGCLPCTVQGDCASGATCSLGYCEKQN